MNVKVRIFPYGEGVANNTSAESCGDDSKVMAEPLTVVRAGRVLSREIQLKSMVLTSWDVMEVSVEHTLG